MKLARKAWFDESIARRSVLVVLRRGFGLAWVAFPYTHAGKVWVLWIENRPNKLGCRGGVFDVNSLRAQAYHHQLRTSGSTRNVRHRNISATVLSLLQHLV